ncbi:MAG: hypothetical protein K9L22_06780 [Methylococcaceae bacterium]|nr:hypothetical protein [Methylococcaceae bacterium]
MFKKTISYYFLALFALSLTACTASQPKNTHNICAIFKEKDDWYDYSKDAYLKWGVPIPIQMAIMYQESRFVADAKPPRPWLLGFIPWFRDSSAYGYPQAQDSTWDWYLTEAGSWGADRDDFEDACDFIGWYCTVSHKKLGISKRDTVNQYLAYHEGHGGFQRKSQLKKPWLLKTAKKVNRQAQIFQQQLNGCKAELENSGSFFW